MFLRVAAYGNIVQECDASKAATTTAAGLKIYPFFPVSMGTNEKESKYSSL